MTHTNIGRVRYRHLSFRSPKTPCGVLGTSPCRFLHIPAARAVLIFWSPSAKKPFRQSRPRDAGLQGGSGRVARRQGSVPLRCLDARPAKGTSLWLCSGQLSPLPCAALALTKRVWCLTKLDRIARMPCGKLKEESWPNSVAPDLDAATEGMRFIDKSRHNAVLAEYIPKALLLLQQQSRSSA